jgi:hypothetical protein
MAYIPSHALAGLRNYKYKGVDKCVRCFHFVRAIAEHPVVDPYSQIMS